MTVSTNGQICYGVLFEEDYEFPWDAERWDNDIDSWWLYEVCGYTNPFELYDELGNYIDGKEPPKERIDQYFSTRQAFEKEHLLPVRLVNYCSGDYPAYILAVPESCIIASRGYPEILSRPRGYSDHTAILGTEDEKRSALLDFCKEHRLEYQSGPAWWLSSYWG